MKIIEGQEVHRVDERIVDTTIEEEIILEIIEMKDLIEEERNLEEIMIEITIEMIETKEEIIEIMTERIEEIIEITIVMKEEIEIMIERIEEIGIMIEIMTEEEIAIMIEKIEVEEITTDLPEESLLRKDKIEEIENLKSLPSWLKLHPLTKALISLSRYLYQHVGSFLSCCQWQISQI